MYAATTATTRTLLRDSFSAHTVDRLRPRWACFSARRPVMGRRGSKRARRKSPGRRNSYGGLASELFPLSRQTSHPLIDLAAPRSSSRRASVWLLVLSLTLSAAVKGMAAHSDAKGEHRAHKVEESSPRSQTVLPTLFIIGILFAPIGGLLIWGASQVCALSLARRRAQDSAGL